MTQPSNKQILLNNNTAVINSINNHTKSVYYVESPDDDTVLLAINVTIKPSSLNNEDVFIISWYDTSHERIMIASRIKQDNNYFAFKRVKQEGGGSYFFVPITLDIYNNKVKQHLTTKADFTDNDEMLKAFLSTIKDEF